MSTPLLSACGITYRYPTGLTALHDLRLDITRGRKLAILGANGAGKTTLLLHLNGTLRPLTGHIHLDSLPARYDRAFLNTWRRRVGVVLQEPDDQIFAATVAQDVSFGPLNLGLSAVEAKARVHEALEALRIAHLADRPTQALSFGQKKRVAIAGIIAMRPEVLVLDEPTAGLDAHGVAHLLGALRPLHEAGTTLVFSTHDVELAYTWADDVALFHEGTVVRQGETVAVLSDKEHMARARMRPPLLLELAQLIGVEPLLRQREEILGALRTFG